MRTEVNKKRYEQIDHTADVGFRVFGATLEELFENAAFALFDIMFNLETVGARQERELRIESSDRVALLVDWLSELNFLFFTEGMVFKEFEILELANTALQATARGEPYDPERHEIFTEVKAITYHGLEINKTDEGWEAQVILDL
jgi:SHS2 domain-containing protein